MISLLKSDRMIADTHHNLHQSNYVQESIIERCRIQRDKIRGAKRAVGHSQELDSASSEGAELLIRGR
jgi:hypothetical protein